MAIDRVLTASDTHKMYNLAREAISRITGGAPDGIKDTNDSSSGKQGHTVPPAAVDDSHTGPPAIMAWQREKASPLTSPGRRIMQLLMTVSLELQVLSTL